MGPPARLSSKVTLRHSHMPLPVTNQWGSLRRAQFCLPIFQTNSRLMALTVVHDFTCSAISLRSWAARLLKTLVPKPKCYIQRCAKRRRARSRRTLIACSGLRQLTTVLWTPGKSAPVLAIFGNPEFVMRLGFWAHMACNERLRNP